MPATFAPCTMMQVFTHHLCNEVDLHGKPHAELHREEVFSKVNFHESKQQVYWKHRLRQAFSTKTQDDAVHRYALFFAHGTNTAGAEGILNRRYLAPTALAVGHYSQATN